MGAQEIINNTDHDKLEPVVDLHAGLLVVRQVVPAHHHQHALTPNLMMMMMIVMMILMMMMTLHLRSSKGSESSRHCHFSATNLPTNIFRHFLVRFCKH